jgi:WD40 repeat protein
LVKLAGKFGRTLIRTPESIYKLIPPFCPHNSVTYQQFGKAEARNLSVSGLSANTWDDSLGRFSSNFGSFASFIQAAGSHIFVLVSSGSVFIYDSFTFADTAFSPIRHGERVYRMQVNSTGAVLVTYAYRTTKVWDVATGACRLSVSNVETGLRPLAMLLKNDLLLVGTDDKCVRTLNTKETSPSWKMVADYNEHELEGHYLNAASHMALNRDGSLLTVAYRGHPLSAWEVDGAVHRGHGWRKEANYRGEVGEALWHPHQPEILGLYTTGQVFKWLPYDGELDELPAGANRLTMSREGSLFATGDVHGTLKVYTTSGFSLIYHLASQDSVLGLAFSPDLRRKYDIRGYHGNAWEPNALLRYAERTGKGTDGDSETESLFQGSMIPVSTPKWVDPIIVLATSPLGRLYCYGTEKGTVVLCDSQRGIISEIHKSSNFFSISHITWSSDGKFLCFSDSSKKIFIVSIGPAGSGEVDPSVGTEKIVSMHSATKGQILQLLFRPDSSHILVHAESMIHSISVDSANIAHSAS